MRAYRIDQCAFAIITTVPLFLAVVSAIAVPATAQSASLVGIYDGHQMEIAAGLELRADGRFRYALSYGALDEEAAGKWIMSGNRVLLTSDPLTAPRFVLVSRGKGVGGLLQVNLEVPNSLSRQYFDAVITKTNGETDRKQLSESGLSLPFTRDTAPTSIRMLFAVFDVASEPLKLDSNSGYAVRFRFEPNDLGKVDFQATLTDCQWRSFARPAWPNNQVQTYETVNSLAAPNAPVVFCASIVLF